MFTIGIKNKKSLRNCAKFLEKKQVFPNINIEGYWKGGQMQREKNKKYVIIN